MNIIDLIKSFFVNDNKNNSEKEQYYAKKKEIEDTAIADTVFWDNLNVDIFKTNIDFLSNWICPYCNNKLTEKKGSSFKCPNCKNKIYKKREILTKTEGLFTEEDRNKIQELWNEYQKRKTFLKYWENINELINVTFSSDKTQNMNAIFVSLRLANPQYFKKNNLSKLRDCRYYEAKLQEMYGSIQQATNCYMQCLFIDLIGDYNTLYDDKDMKQELLEDLRIEKENIKNYIKAQKEEVEYYEKMSDLHNSSFDKKDYEYELPKVEESLLEWMNVGCNIYPEIYQGAFEENLSIEKFEQIFKFNAESLLKNIKFDLPISVDEAWNKVLDYRNNLKENNN